MPFKIPAPPARSTHLVVSQGGIDIFLDGFDFDSEQVLQRLLLAGRKECLDFIIERLDSENEASRYATMRDGEPVEWMLRKDNDVAEMLSPWRTDDFEYDTTATEAERRAKRRQLKSWLEHQFARIQAGQEPEMVLYEGAVQSGKWEIYAP